MATTTHTGAEATICRAIVAGLSSYEAVAITTGKVPTISSHLWRMPMAPRCAVVLATVVLFVDHTVTRRWS